jgi:centrosomal protein CEP104
MYILFMYVYTGNARIREGARKGLEVLAASTNIGSTVVASHGIKPLPSKQASAWRPISTRLQLLTDLVTTYGIGGGTGLATEGVMNFAKAAGAFAHSNAEVRDSAKELTVAVHAVVGTGAIDGYLRALRPKQLEEYHAAFEGNPIAQKKESNGYSSEHKSPDAKQHQSDHHKSPSKVNTSAVKRSADNEAPDEGEETPDFTICMFCGEADSKWNEDALDLHYWKDCALLAPCPACAQVVEVAGLPEHLLDECDQKASFVPCDVTGKCLNIYTYICMYIYDQKASFVPCDVTGKCYSCTWLSFHNLYTFHFASFLFYSSVFVYFM